MTQLPAKAALRGEILRGDDTVRVFIAPHPLRAERHEIAVAAGLTVDDMVALACKEIGQPALASTLVATIDGHPVLTDHWDRIRPKAGTTVVLRAVPEDIFSAAIAVFSAISGAVASASAFIGGLGLVGKVIGIGLSLGSQFLLNALFPARKPELAAADNEKAKPSYSLTGSRNTAAPFEAIPVVLGSHRVTPLYAGQPYTESVGEDQFLRCLFVWGYGPLDIVDLRIGETPIASFDDVEVETRFGYPGDTPVTLYPRQAIEEPLSVDLKQADGWHRRTTAANVGEISLDIVFPQGLYWINRDDGKRYAWSALIQARYRRVGTEPWTYFPDTYLHTKTLDTIRRSVRSQVADGQYEVEVARISADADQEGENTFVEDAVWTALRGFRNTTPITFDKPLAITAVRIRATSQLNGSLDTLNGICTSVVKGWTSVEWFPALASRNPADLFRWVLQGPMNARPVPDGEIDLPALQAWNIYCAQRNFRFDQVRQARSSVWDTLGDICSAGRAVPIFKDGKWSVVWDEANAPIVQMFTPRNSWGFEATRSYSDLPHGWRVRFVNREKGFIEDERIVYDDGYSAANATRFEGLEFPGVTDPNAIWRHGRFHIAQLRLRPETITLSIDFENLVCTRADRVLVQHDVMLLGQTSGRVVAVDTGAQTVALDEVVTLLADRLYAFRFRLANGSFATRTVDAGQQGERTVLQLAGSGALPELGDLFAFGEAERETAVYRILSIEAQDELTARLTLVDDAPGISVADQGAIPTFQTNVTAPADPFTLPPADLRVSQRVYEEDGQFLVEARLDWTIPRAGRVSHFEIEIRDDTDPQPRFRLATTVAAPQMFALVAGLDAGAYTPRVRSIFVDGSPSSWATAQSFTTVGLLTPPPDVQNFAVSVIGDLATLSWSPVAVPGLAHYEIRYADDGTTVEWNSATALVPRASGNSVQVPALIGTYLIKAVLGTGLKSPNATLIRTSIAAIAGMNVVEVIDEAPSFAGTLDRVEVSDGALRLQSRNVIAKWEVLDDVISLARGDGASDSVGLHVTGLYGFAQSLDLSQVYTSRITARIDAAGENTLNVIDLWATLDDVAMMDDAEPEDWSVGLEYRTTNDAPSPAAAWSTWQPFVVGDVTARAFEFRLRLTGRRGAEPGADYSTTTPVVTGLEVEIDMPDRVAAGEDIVIPAAGLRVTFDPPFIALTGIATADQNLQGGDYKAITNKGPTGFDIRFFNANGQSVERIIDYVAKGYGARVQ